MAALFPRWSNNVLWLALGVSGLVAIGAPAAAMVYVRTPYATRRDDPRDQPVMFDHRHHVRDNGIDCYYCHDAAERSRYAGVPSSALCMNCHSQVWNHSPLLEPVRKSYYEHVPIAWKRVNGLPDFVNFDHSIHVKKGVGCATCHGRVDLMARVYQEAPLTMEWCLDCHRAPERFLRPPERVTDMSYDAHDRQLAVGAEVKRRLGVEPRTDCSTCHYLKNEARRPMSDTGAEGPGNLRAEAYGRALSELDGAVDRREFLRLMGASLALAGASGCSREVHDEIVPYVVSPPELVPGRPAHYATTWLRDGCGVGIVATCHDGRPTKLEGNPEHPASLGATGRGEQAALLGLYDPDRAKAIREGHSPRTWRALLDAFGVAAPEKSPHYGRGGGLHFLLEPASSPLVASLIARIRSLYPEARFTYYKPFHAAARWQGAKLAFGRIAEPVFDLGRADAVVALDADILDEGPAAIRYAHDFMSRRRLRSPTDAMSRLYVAESRPTVTGANADARLAVRPSEIGALAARLFAEITQGVGGAARSASGGNDASRTALSEERAAWVRAASRALLAARGASAVVVGDAQPSAVHAAAHAINALLRNTGATVRHIEPPLLEAGAPSHELSALAHALDAGEVDTLVVLDGNPAYTAPAALELARKVGRARRSLYLGLYENETARACGWFVPAAHPLEAWGDALAFDGTASIVQPLVVPLYGGRSLAQMLAAFAGEPDARGLELVRRVWAAQTSPGDRAWQDTLRQGMITGSASPRLGLEVDYGAVARAVGDLAMREQATGIELVTGRDARVDDGRYANNAWLQELPDPITKQAWGNAAWLSAATAARLGVKNEDAIELRSEGRSLRAPALVVAGHADDVIYLAAGYGREGDERVARGVGANVYTLMKAGDDGAVLVDVTKVEGAWPLAITQGHDSLRDRSPLRAATLEHYRREPHFARESGIEADSAPKALYALSPHAGDQWAMAIDLAACTGCSACVVACQAENNVPVVGFEGVRKRREMHWLRIDRYISGPLDGGRYEFQPMLCQHCESAPCEYVCPVNATTHSADGLNQMTYNRCVGTRFCSNNCPYKVRRFNYFNYNDGVAPSHKLAMNPNVTVRARGVMEKCSFCVQRIRAAQIDARGAQRPLAEGEVVTACQQACPTSAISFGSLSEPRSRVRALHTDDRAYAALGELGTRPRVRYLARITNPDPALERVPT